jgi:superfamily II DNA or RNA helicase/HKD family nuclease
LLRVLVRQRHSCDDPGKLVRLRPGLASAEDVCELGIIPGLVGLARVEPAGVVFSEIFEVHAEDVDEATSGLYEALLTGRMQELISRLPEDRLTAGVADLLNAEAADRVSRHIARLLEQAINAMPERERVARAVQLAADVLGHLQTLTAGTDLGLAAEIPIAPGQVLQSIRRYQPDGTPEIVERPLTPLLDTTVLTNAHGEPAVAHEVRAEIASADGIDVLMAFIRWTGIRGQLIDGLRRHVQAGKPLRVLTTTYTNSTEQFALDELTALGAEVRVSYDTSLNRLHAKAWMFHRSSGYSTAYIGSSNLTYSAQVTGLEWNVRLAQARNPDAVAKMAAVFESYWAGGAFKKYDPVEFAQRTAVEVRDELTLSPLEVELKPFQELLLDQIALARYKGHHRNLLVAATGTGKTVMAAVDYARLRAMLPRDRLLFIAHREEILDQSRNTFRQVLRDAAFGEKWVGSDRPSRFEHVFASIQSLNASGVTKVDPSHFDMVVIDEFHHAAAPSYEAVLGHLRPIELLGLTATPERADGLDVLAHFDNQIAAELRLWDAIDQQYLVPFGYFGIHDGLDLRDIPWRRGRGYDIDALTGLLTADHIWAHQVIEQVRQKVAEPHRMRALGFCVSVKHAQFMAERFERAGIASVAIWGDSAKVDRQGALRDLASGRRQVVFTVDLFNEGVDVPAVDTLLMLRPTESPTLFLQQLGRGLRKSHGKSLCTVLDFVGQHRREFRYDRRFRALLGGTRTEVIQQVDQGFPFLPAGCSMELDPVAQEIVLSSIRNAIPSRWREKCEELRPLGDVSLSTYLQETGLELEDVYANGHTWTEMRRVTGKPTAAPGPNETALLRAVGRLIHIDDDDRIERYQSFVTATQKPDPDALDERSRRLLRMLIGSVTSLPIGTPMKQAIDQLWAHPQVRVELGELLAVLPNRVDHLPQPLDLDTAIPLRPHSRYTRKEILAAFNVGEGSKPRDWQEGVLHAKDERADLFAFTLDKSSGGFSPTTRYRDYAVSRELIHWESQSATSVASNTGQRYINHEALGSSIVMFARLSSDDRSFWCLGTARYQSHQNERPIAFVWKLDHPLPPDLYLSFAAAVA